MRDMTMAVMQFTVVCTQPATAYKLPKAFMWEGLTLRVIAPEMDMKLPPMKLAMYNKAMAKGKLEVVYTTA